MKYAIGETVYWSGGWGEEPEKLAKVIGTGSKNGMVVYDLNNGRWAYEYQLRVCEETQPCVYCGEEDCPSPEDCPVRRQHIEEDKS